MKHELNKIKPETGENANALKTIINVLEDKLKKAQLNGKMGSFISIDDLSLFTASLMDVRRKMIVHIMRLQKCNDMPANGILRDTERKHLNKMITMNADLMKRNDWLEKRMDLKTAYYATKTQSLPDLSKHER